MTMGPRAYDEGQFEYRYVLAFFRGLGYQCRLVVASLTPNHTNNAPTASQDWQSGVGAIMQTIERVRPL